jgi:hypothetical protein
MVDLEEIRARSLRSFRRLETALQQLVAALRDNRHLVSSVTPGSA